MDTPPADAPLTDLIYASRNRFVLAIDPATGRRVWETKLPTIWGGYTTLMVRADYLIAGRGTYVFGLNRWTGEVLWERELPGSGGSVVSIAAEGADSVVSAALIEAAAAQDSAGEAAASSG